MTNSPPARRLALDVRVYGELVGLLHRDREGRTRFNPDASWLSRGQRPPLGLAFLAQPGPRLAGTGLPLWFDNLLPELDSALRGRICRQLNLRESDAPALLRAVGHDLPGAVEVSGDADEDESSIPEPVPEGRLRFSLAGMQLKLSMLRYDEARFKPLQFTNERAERALGWRPLDYRSCLDRTYGSEAQGV